MPCSAAVLARWSTTPVSARGGRAARWWQSGFFFFFFFFFLLFPLCFSLSLPRARARSRSAGAHSPHPALAAARRVLHRPRRHVLPLCAEFLARQLAAAAAARGGLRAAGRGDLLSVFGL